MELMQAGAGNGEHAPGPRRRGLSAPTSRRRLLADRIAGWAVTGGGLAVIACILGILLFILVEVLPLGRGARVSPEPSVPLGDVQPVAVVTDEYRTHAALLTPEGRFQVFDLADGRRISDSALTERTLTAFQTPPGRQVLAAASGDGKIFALPVGWRVDFDGEVRRVTAVTPEPLVLDLDPTGGAVQVFSVRLDEDDTAAAVAVLASGDLAWVRREVDENEFTGEVSVVGQRQALETSRVPDVLLLGDDLESVYAGTSAGDLYWWDQASAGGEPQVAAGGASVTALSLLIGDRSLVVGRSDGSLEVWFPVRRHDNTFELTRVRQFPSRPSAIRAISPSMRNKGFVVLDAAGGLGLYHSTSERVLWTDATARDATALFFTPRADGLLVASRGSLERFGIQNPHPEVSLRALFGRVWYEGYERPAYAWQSTGGTDDFEPKLSLVPLMVGTLKGTFYSLILAIPIGVLAAMYTAQFMHPRLKKTIKPTVEIMAAMPSVVLGFLAGLWLAPRVEHILPALVLALIVLPTLTVLTGLAWRSLPRRIRGRSLPGAEVVLYMIAVAVGLWICLQLNETFERLVFGGSVQLWLSETTGLRYDQRNAIVVGLAMGLAVIPVIFSIAEDAFSNVPSNLISGSLALGANRWQTVTQVVLPTASPGIFSAIMIGFGRAVGETMIVLMATGNTPVLDWNPFNGFRTLSANIAVEIPEAPQGDTLYRMLFLAALILFVFTFSINTVAELVRQRLRRRYARL